MTRRALASRTAMAILFTGIALLGALAVLPARWLVAFVPAGWPLAVVDASGPIWQGAALVAVGDAGNRATVPEPVRWHVAWRNGPRIHLVHPWLGCELTLRPGLSAVGLSPCTMRLPASTLAAMGAPFNTLQPGGTLQLGWPALRLPYGTRLPAGELATLEWRDATSGVSRIQPLGHYRLGLVGTQQGTIDLVLATLSGPLHMQGSGSLHPRNGLRFSGRAGPAPSATEQTVAGLQALLSAIGRRSGQDTLLHFGR